MAAPDNHNDVRIAHLPPAPVNETFGDYVQAHAFNLGLSRPMIYHLVDIHDNADMLMNHHRFYGELSAQHAIVRRGLAIRHTEWWDTQRDLHPVGWLQNQPLRMLWEVTNAGKLVVLLLQEAGMIQANRRRALPPPPPGWIDPRPKLVLR